MMKQILYKLLLLFIVLVSCSAKPVNYKFKDSTWTATYPVSEEIYLLIPLGSTASPTFTTVVSINKKPYKPRIKTDGFGNSWASIALSDINGLTELKVRYTITKRKFVSYPSVSKADITWLDANRYIDWKDPSILSVVRKLDLTKLERPDAIRKIGDYVVKHLTFVQMNGRKPQPPSVPASITLATGKGVCINYSRLFVALSRASGIPARTVNGAIRHPRDTTSYEFHHEWIEYLGKEGNWHPVDLRYLQSYELNDPRYIGFVYGAEDHPWFAKLDNQNLLSGQPVQLENGDVVLFHYHPIFRGARYGFKLIDSRDTEYYVIEKTIRLRKAGNTFVIQQSPAS